MSTHSIRQYRAADRTALIDLWKRTFPDDPPHNEPARMLDAKLEVDDLVFIAEEDGRLRGACMAGYDGHRGWIYALAVSAKSRRAGLGSSLVEHVVAALRERGCIKVNLQVRTTNAGVVNFYRSLGFSTEDRISMGLRIE